MTKHSHHSVLQSAYIIIAVGLIFYIRSHSFFTAPNLVEFGDNGVNEIQIEGAKHFIETYGNYSRWTFHHPGPAFYYLYSFGQAVLFNGFHTVGSPLAAHYMMAILLQTVCISFVVITIGRRFKSSAFVPVALAMWALHILHPDLSPATIWPPNAVVGPLMVCIVSSTLVASGEAWALLPLALSDGLLLNGHVAQPLFVGPLTLYGMGAGLLARTLPRDRRTLVWVAASAAAGALLLTPIAIDLFEGASSNTAIILAHLKTHGGVAHSFRRAVGYLLSFVVYQDDTDAVQGGPAFSLSTYAWAHRSALAGAALAITTGHAWMLTYRRSRFTVSLCGATWLAVVLTILWGMRQDGPMFKFNGFLNAGIVYLLYVPAIAMAVTALCRTTSSAAVSGVACCFGVAAISLQPTDFAPYTAKVPNLNKAVLRSAHDTGASGVVLDFDAQFWLESAGVAEMVLEDDLPMRAPHFAAWLFRPRNAWTGDAALDAEWRDQHRPITLRISKASGAPGEIPLPDDGRLIFPGREGPVAVTIDPN